MQNASFLKVGLVYVLTILGVLLWSGSDQEKSVYDRFLVSFKGVEVEVSTLEFTKDVFSKFLKFDIKDESKEDLVIILPDKKTVKIVKSETSLAPSKVSIKIQVKNGISQFREVLAKRLEDPEIKTLGISLSKLESNNTHHYFTVDSQSEVRVVFYHRKFFSKN